MNRMIYMLLLLLLFILVSLDTALQSLNESSPRIHYLTLTYCKSFRVFLNSILEIRCFFFIESDHLRFDKTTDILKVSPKCQRTPFGLSCQCHKRGSQLQQDAEGRKGGELTSVISNIA
jgi:hypothetical protein